MECDVYQSNFFSLKIYVQDPVTGEVYSDRDVLEVTEGDSLGLTCVSVGGRPAPDLAWRTGSDVVQGTQTMMELASGDWVVTRGLEASVSAAWHEASLSCEAEHRAMARPLVTSVILLVRHRPVIRDVRTREEDVGVGGEVTLVCEAESHPPVESVTWHRAGQPHRSLGASSELRLRDLRPEDTGTYVCVAENSQGRSQRELYLDFPYPAEVRAVFPSETVVLNPGAHVELGCDVRGNPIPDVWWVKEGQQEVGRGSVLILDNNKNNYSLGGNYECRAGNIVRGQHRLHTGSVITLEVRGPPILLHQNKHISAEASSLVSPSSGENVELRVDFCSNPKSEIQWTDGNGNILSETGPGQPDVRVNIIELSDLCYASSLTLLNVDSSSHSDFYSIKLENELGTLTEEFRVVLAPHWLSAELVVASVSGLVLTALLLLFVMISLCRSRSLAQADLESRGTESETYSRDNSSEDLIYPPQPPLSPALMEARPCMRPASGHPATEERFSDIYSFPRAANGGGSLRKGKLERKVFNECGYIHINTNAYSYVSFDDVDKQISNIL